MSEVKKPKFDLGEFTQSVVEGFDQPTQVVEEEYDEEHNDVKDIDDVPQLLRDQIGHFFENYKDLEKGKWVKVKGWGNADEARQMILDSAEAYKNA